MSVVLQLLKRIKTDYMPRKPMFPPRWYSTSPSQPQRPRDLTMERVAVERAFLRFSATFGGSGRSMGSLPFPASPLQHGVQWVPVLFLFGGNLRARSVKSL
jgi:hypothetical protein